MALPKQVQAQVHVAEEYDKQVAAAQQAAEPKPEDEQQQSSEPEPEKQSQEPVSVETPKPTEEDATWKQRYLSLQGQYNSQVPTLQQQVRQLTDSMDQLQVKLKEQKAEPQSEPEPSQLVTNKDVEAFGEDLVDLARRIAKEEFGRRESKYIKQIEALEGQLTKAEGQVGEVVQSQAKTAQDRFFENLNSTLPTWEAIQATDDCQTWLATRIPGSQATWNDALLNAAGRQDVSAVKEVFDTFFERYPAHNPSAKKQQQSNARQELNRQVAPGKSTASTPSSQNGRIYTSADYIAESNRIVRLSQQGKHDQAMQLQTELDAAQTEGRIRP